MKPLRKVVHRKLKDGSPVFMDGATARHRWWRLKLECGHLEERGVRYQKNSHGEWGFGIVYALPSRDFVLPPPKRVRCSFCPSKQG